METPFVDLKAAPASTQKKRNILTIIIPGMLVATAVATLVALFVFNDGHSSSNESSSVTRPLIIPAGMKLSVGGQDGGAASFLSNQPRIMMFNSNGDVSPYVELTNRFNNDFKQKFIDWANQVGLTDGNGNRLNVINAAILGYPSSPIPLEGHVTHDFMSQSGGVHLHESVPITYEIVDPSFEPALVQTVLYKQDSSASALHKLTYTQSHTSSQTLSVTAGISTEIATEESVTVPGLGIGAKLNTKITASLSTTASNTESMTTTWSTEEDITIPANSVTNATCFLATGKLDTAFHGVLTATGDSNVGWVFYDDRVYKGDTPWFWFFQNAQTIDGLRGYLYAAGSQMSIDFPVSGYFHGVAGTRVECEVHSCPYTPETSVCYR